MINTLKNRKVELDKKLSELIEQKEELFIERDEECRKVWINNSDNTEVRNQEYSKVFELYQDKESENYHQIYKVKKQLEKLKELLFVFED